MHNLLREGIPLDFLHQADVLPAGSFDGYQGVPVVGLAKRGLELTQSLRNFPERYTSKQQRERNP